MLIQPIAAEDVASAVAEVTVGPPANSIARMLDAAGDETVAVLDELRELAYGIYPRS